MYERDNKHKLKMFSDSDSIFCENPCTENAALPLKSRQKTLEPNPQKHLIDAHRKYFPRRRMSSVFCQIVLAFQFIIFLFGLQSIEVVNALEEYNRLSISDTSLIDIDAINGQSKHYASAHRHQNYYFLQLLPLSKYAY